MRQILKVLSRAHPPSCENPVKLTSAGFVHLLAIKKLRTYCNFQERWENYVA